MPMAQQCESCPVWTLRQEILPARPVLWITISIPPLSPSILDTAHCRRSNPGACQPCHSCGPVVAGSFLKFSSQGRSFSVTGRRLT
jgi:hypothetical protein